MERLPGKAQVHVTSCRNLGKHNVPDCGCPTRLSFATVEFSKMREGEGREGAGGGTGDWNVALPLGSPTASAEVHNYLKAFSSEQFHLSCFILGRLCTPGITDTQLFVYTRNAALFKALFFSGDLANHLSLVKTQEIMRFPYNHCLLFNHVWEIPSDTAPPIFLRYDAIRICLYVQ